MKKAIDKIVSIFSTQKEKPVVFFGYSAQKKKKIIIEAAKEAARMQRETVKQYHKAYNSK